jgi:hypothetical protein
MSCYLNIITIFLFDYKDDIQKYKVKPITF